MRVLLCYRGFEYLGLEYISSYLKARGHEVELLFDPGLDNNLYYQCKPLNVLNRYPTLLKKAEAFAPHIIAISSLTNLFPHAKEMIRRLRSKIEAPVIVGGVHATVLPEYVLNTEGVDMVCRGEGEESLVELLEKMERGAEIWDIKNIWFKREGEIIDNPMRPLIKDLDRLPFPDKDMFYRCGAFRDLIMILTGRGCPYRCTYCVNSYYHDHYKKLGKLVRRRSVENVLEEIHIYKGKYPVKSIYFADEVFTLHRDWIELFLERYKEEIGLPFVCNYVPSTIDRKLATLAKSADCIMAMGSIESGDLNIRNSLYEKPFSDKAILQSAKTLKEAGIPISTSAIFGNPMESEASEWRTIHLVEAIKPDIVNTYLLYPFPGTKIYDSMLEKGLVTKEIMESVQEGRHSYHQSSLLSPSKGARAQTMANLLPLYIKLPKSCRRYFRFFIDKKIPKLSKYIYIASSLIVYRGYNSAWMKNLLRMMFMASSPMKK